MYNNYKINYDPSATIVNNLVLGSLDTGLTASALTRGLMPSNLLDVTAKSLNYRDSVLNSIAHSLEEEKQSALGVLIGAIETCPDMDPKLSGYSEYAAAIALMLNQPDVAAKVIARNERNGASSLLQTLATVIARKIYGSVFIKMVTDSGPEAYERWTMVDRPAYFPGQII